MSTIQDTLAAIAKELEGLRVPGPLTKAMTSEELIEYTKEQIALAKKDTDPGPRIKALSEVVNLAKAYSWEDGGTMSVAVYSGELSVQAGSRQAEIMDTTLGVPGPQASSSSGGMEAPSGVTGPATNTARPVMRIMPPALPESTPAAGGEGWIAKAESVLKSVDGGAALLAELKGMLGAEARPGDGAGFRQPVVKDEGWPADLATKEFLEGKPASPRADDFGSDPSDLTFLRGR